MSKSDALLGFTCGSFTSLQDTHILQQQDSLPNKSSVKGFVGQQILYS